MRKTNRTLTIDPKIEMYESNRDEESATTSRMPLLPTTEASDDGPDRCNCWGQYKDLKPTAARLAAKVWFAVDVRAHAEPTAEPTKQDQRAPIKMVSGRAWSLGIYQALRLLGKSLDVAWERAFIHPLTFNEEISAAITAYQHT
jgi:hypothetical protein